jgi:hypothetical protein
MVILNPGDDIKASSAHELPENDLDEKPQTARWPGVLKPRR